MVVLKFIPGNNRRGDTVNDQRAAESLLFAFREVGQSFKPSTIQARGSLLLMFT